MNKLLASFPLIAAFSMNTSVCNAARVPTFVIDQQSTVGFSRAGASSPQFLLGQSFTPARNGIDAIELNVSILSRPAQMRISLLDGVVGVDGLSGTVLGTTSTQTITSTDRRRVRFRFPDTIPLTPGKTYAMQFEPLGSNSNPQIEINTDPIPNPYAGGQALQLNIATNDLLNRDFVFAEGIYVIPEPSSGFLSVCGTMLVSMLLRKSRLRSTRSNTSCRVSAYATLPTCIGIRVRVRILRHTIRPARTTCNRCRDWSIADRIPNASDFDASTGNLMQCDI